MRETNKSTGSEPADSPLAAVRPPLAFCRSPIAARHAFLCIPAIALAPFLPALWRGEIPFFMDTLSQFYPLRFHAAQLLRQGEWPLWTRSMFCGVPLLANPQWGLLYPGNWPFLAWPGPFWFTLSYPLHFAIGAWGAHALVFERTRSRAGAWAGAILALGNSLALSRIAFGAHHLALAWAPWSWLAVARLGRPGHFRPACALAALAFAMQGLSGAPQIACYSGFSCLILAFALGGEAGSPYRRAVRRRMAGLALAGAIGAALAAPQILPTLLFLGECDRGQGLSLEAVRQGALDASGLLRAFLGGAGFPEDAESTAYIGAGGAMLAALALLARARRALPWAAVLGAALLHSWQGASPLLYRSLPGYAHFHDPKRALALAVLAACVLGGIGAAAAFGRAAEAPKRRLGFWLALALAVLDVGAAKALAPIAPQRPWALEWPALGWFGWPFGATDLNWILWGALAWAAFWTAMAGANKAPRAAAFALIAGMGLELWLFSAARNDLKTVRADRFFPAGVASSSSPMAKALGAAGSLASPAGGAARFFSFDTRAQYSYDYARLDTRLFPNMASYYGLEDVQGYDAFKLKPYVRTLAAINLGATNLYPSHFGLISNPASPLLNRLCARFAEGQADALPALPVPPAAPGEPIRPAIRLRPLDEPATATLVFEAYFPAMPPNGAPDPGWARIAFPLADGRSMPEARSLFGAEYILKQSDAAWIGGRWTGRLPAGAGTPEIHLSDPAARLVVLDYWETTPSSASPWRRLIPARADLPPWFESRGAEPLISLWPRAAFASPSAASGGDRGALLLERDQPLPAFAWPDGQGTGRVLSARIRSSRVDIRAEAPAGGAFLLLRDAWAPGWTAQVDGRPAPLLRADGMFRAVPLDAGEREIVFRYRAPGLAAGLALAAAGLAGLAGLCAASCKARTTRRKTSS